MSAEISTTPEQMQEAPVFKAAQLKMPVAYYDDGRQIYWIQDSADNYITVNETCLKRLLRGRGFAAKIQEGESMSSLDQCLSTIVLERTVKYAGPLAGYEKGPREMCGLKILVTTSPKLIEPTEGECPVITNFLEGRFGEEQLPYLFGWLKCAFESLREGKSRPSQVLVLAGEADSGKSLFQAVVTLIFGGRVAKPYRYMSGRTDFNGDLFGAEHLMIEDEVPSATNPARRALASKIKEFTVNPVQSCHGKNRDARSLEPRWRVTISVNNEPENLMILPPLDDSLKDKIILLKVAKAPMPMPTETLVQREAFWNSMLAELPAFLYYLTRWEIPAELKSDRFGITHFHHPELLQALNDLADEARLLSLIDWGFQCGALEMTGFEGTAERLQSLLCVHPYTAHEAKRLLQWPSACGTYLGRLAKEHPDRVIQARTASQRGWRITPPKECPKTAPLGAPSNGHEGASPQAPEDSIFCKRDVVEADAAAFSSDDAVTPVVGIH